MQSTEEGSVRVDLLGGTLDLDPINLILPKVVTLNVATTLKSKVKISERDDKNVSILSHDYKSETTFSKSDFNFENIYINKYFKELTFVVQILDLFGVDEAITLELSSGAPAGSGLGGSSTMGVVLYKALSEFLGRKFDRQEAISKIRAIEGRILNRGLAGYQDYYPALYGGVLALIPHPGEVEIKQLYDDQLKKFLETHITLVFSGVGRFSGINNWEVYKAFFDGDQKVRQGLAQIALLSHEAYESILTKNFNHLLNLISVEGMEREKLFPNIVAPLIQTMFKEVKKDVLNAGLKVCGAGGGGCFILVHNPEDKEIIRKTINKYKMTELEFQICPPIES